MRLIASELIASELIANDRAPSGYRGELGYPGCRGELGYLDMEEN